MFPTIVVWQRGSPMLGDMPSGRYELVYRIPKPAALPALIAARRMVGKLQPIATGQSVKVLGFKMIDRWFSPNIDFVFSVEVVGAELLLIIVGIVAIAAALGVFAIFTNATAVEFRKVMLSPAVQDKLRQLPVGSPDIAVAGNIAMVGGVLLALGIAGVAIYGIVKQKAVA